MVFLIDLSLSSILPCRESAVGKIRVNSLTVYLKYFSSLVQLKWPRTPFPNKNELNHFSAAAFPLRGCLGPVWLLEVLVAWGREPDRGTASWKGQKPSLALFTLCCVTSAVATTYLNQHMSVAEVQGL